MLTRRWRITLSGVDSFRFSVEEDEEAFSVSRHLETHVERRCRAVR